MELKAREISDSITAEFREMGFNPTYTRTTQLIQISLLKCSIQKPT